MALDVNPSPALADDLLCCAPLSTPELDDADAEDLARILKVMGDPIRLRLVNLAASGEELCACDLPEILGRSQPTVSHHLSLLVKAGLFEREQRGKWAWFRLREDQLTRVREALS